MKLIPHKSKYQRYLREALIYDLSTSTNHHIAHPASNTFHTSGEIYHAIPLNLISDISQTIARKIAIAHIGHIQIQKVNIKKFTTSNKAVTFAIQATAKKNHESNKSIHCLLESHHFHISLSASTWLEVICLLLSVGLRLE